MMHVTLYNFSPLNSLIGEAISNNSIEPGISAGGEKRQCDVTECHMTTLLSVL